MTNTKSCRHLWDKDHRLCTKCGKVKQRHFYGDRREHSCGCIYLYNPGPEGWRRWLACDKHEKQMQELRAERMKARS